MKCEICGSTKKYSCLHHPIQSSKVFSGSRQVDAKGYAERVCVCVCVLLIVIGILGSRCGVVDKSLAL